MVKAAAYAAVQEYGGVPAYLYPIPTGGYSAALLIQNAFVAYRGRGHCPGIAEQDHPLPESHVLVVDDVYDSGKTAEPYLKLGQDVMALFGSAKATDQEHVFIGAPLPEHDYLVLPWEGNVSGPEDAVRRLLQHLGVDPDEGHFKDTPRRVLAWLDEFKANQEPAFNSTMFEESDYTGIVIERNLPFVSLCAHHLLPFVGTAAVAYIPRSDRNAVVSAPNAREAALAMRDLPRRILGLSKLARIVQHCAKRPTVQENLTEAIRRTISETAGSPDVGVVLTAEHLCMSYRGPRVPGHETITSSLSGAFYDDPRAREELMLLVRK